MASSGRLSKHCRSPRQPLVVVHLYRRGAGEIAGKRTTVDLREDAPLWLAGGLVLALLFGLVWALVASDGPEGRDANRAGTASASDAYRLTLSADRRSVRLSGVIDFGVKRALATLLASAPEVRVLRLESAGGRVAEARGLAKLVHHHALVTSAVGECASACTLVLLSAERRYLEPSARLGFHRYGQRSPLVGIFLDPAVEQTRDRALFRGRGISEAFLARVAATPHEAMWFPTTAELVAAGVVDAVGHPR